MRCLAAFFLVALSSLPVAAYDVTAAAAAFAADRAKLPPSAPVLGGWRGNDSHVTEYSIERIPDQAAWTAAWARHAPGESAPAVDFSKAMVIAIFAGKVRTRVLPSINLLDVVEGDKIDVTTMNYVYDVIRAETANLYLFVVLRRSTKPVRVLAKSYGLMRSPQESTEVLMEFDAIPRTP